MLWIRGSHGSKKTQREQEIRHWESRSGPTTTGLGEMNHRLAESNQPQPAINIEQQFFKAQRPTPHQAEDMVDYGYEDHKPSPKLQRSKKISHHKMMIPAPHLLESTETSESHVTASPVFLKESDFPPIPADRQARKQRSFHRRGGEGHGTLLRAAVMASMEDGIRDSDDDNGGRQSSRNSSISLQSLQEALSETTSPRKRARHAQAIRSASSIEFESEEDEENPAGTDDDQQLEDQVLQFTDDEEEDDNILQTSADFDELAMNSSFRSLRKQHQRSYSGSMMQCQTSLLDSSLTSLPEVRSLSVGTRRLTPRRWVSRRTSYDSWASAESDYNTEEDEL